MAASLVYYITGHGYGHAMRSALVIGELLARRQDLRIHVRTGAPRQIFDPLGPRVHYEQVILDPGSLEKDALTIDWPATLDAVRRTIAHMHRDIARECAYIREHGVSLIVADIPFLAGYIAEEAAVPCWGVGNFTWDWIYQTQVDSPNDPILAAATGGYRKMAGLLRLPFPHEMPQFQQVIDVPLVTSAVRPALRDPSAPKRILIAQRGGISPDVIRRAAAASPELHFVSWNDTQTPPAANLERITPADGVTFTQVLATCDAVISKPGHGIVSDCIALGVGLLWPPRDYFREDQMLIDASRPYLRSRPISRDDFLAGNWRKDLLALLSMPHPTQTLPTNGAAVIADHLLNHLPA